jgi:uncharacterized protein (UPF0212 family)
MNNEVHLSLYYKRTKLNSGWLHFVRNELGEVLCPLCKVKMENLEVTISFLADHYLCVDSMLVFYGDDEGIALCRYPDRDVNCESLKNFRRNDGESTESV